MIIEDALDDSRFVDSLTQLREAQRHQRARNKTLELIARSYPLYNILTSIVTEIERCNAGVLACLEVVERNGKPTQFYWGDGMSIPPAGNLNPCWTEAVVNYCQRTAQACRYVPDRQ